MKRWAPRTIGVIALVAAGVFLLLPRRTADNRVDLNGRTASAAGFADELTLRNVTRRDIQYTIKPNAYTRLPRTRALRVGAVDRVRTDVPLEVTWDGGSRIMTYTVFPGRPYSFRNDEKGLARIYPGSHGREDAADLAPFVPTPLPVVERMLEMASVGPSDVVYDIGCGDGRMVIAAARTFRARAVGIDIDAKLIAVCRENARTQGVEKSTRFICMDATKAHITEATVLALYLLPESLEDLEPLFERELKPGGRIVSHNYRIPGWDERIVRRENLTDEKGREHRIYLYVMPGKAPAAKRDGDGTPA